MGFAKRKYFIVISYMKDRASCYNCILQIYQFWYTLHAIIPIVMYNACKNNKNETIRDIVVFQKFCANSSCKLSFAFRANITTANITYLYFLQNSLHNKNICIRFFL